MNHYNQQRKNFMCGCGGISKVTLIHQKVKSKTKCECGGINKVTNFMYACLVMNNQTLNQKFNLM